MDKLRFISDPGHGWLVVPIDDVHESGIEVSNFSYMDMEFYYLEEDCDATKYLEAKGLYGPIFDEIQVEDFSKHCRKLGIVQLGSL